MSVVVDYTVQDFIGNPIKVRKILIDDAYYNNAICRIQNGIMRVSDNKKYNTTLGVLVKHKNKNIIILNADEGENYNLVGDCHKYDFPTLSFACLSKFFNNKNHDSKSNITKIATQLKSGTFKVIAWTKEEVKTLKSGDHRKYTNWVLDKKKGNCPIVIPAGFAIVNGSLHKAGGVLLKDTRKNGKSMVFGVDENQYFGCELPTNPTTMKQAFIDLIPKNIRNIPEVVRTGEWFLVPVSKKEIPNDNEFSIIVYTDFDLPIDDLESNTHHVHCLSGGIKDGVIYAENPVITHDEHEDVDLTGWYSFHKNTALRSVSQQGVD